MSFLDDIVTQLQDENVATLGTNLFVSTQATVPSLVGSATLQVIATGGTTSDKTHNKVIKPAYLQPGAQLTAAADDYKTAENMAVAAYFALVKVRNQFINSGWYMWIKATQEPSDTSANVKGKARVGFNVIARKRP
jgi:hypothetical protein